MKKIYLCFAALLALLLAGCSGDVFDIISRQEDPPGTDWRTYRGYSYGTINDDEELNILYFLYDDNTLDFYWDDDSRTSILTLDLSETGDPEYVAINLFFADKNDDGYNDLCLRLPEDQLAIWLWEPDYMHFANHSLSPDRPWLTFAPWPEALVYWDSSENELGATQYTWSLPGDARVVVERRLPLEGGMEAVLQSVAEESKLEPAAITGQEDEHLSQKLGCTAYALAYETHEETGSFLHEERYVRDEVWDYRVHIATPLQTEGDRDAESAGELLQNLAYQRPIPPLYDMEPEPAAADIPGLLGNYTVISGGYFNEMQGLDDFAQGFLQQAVQISDSLYLLWRIGGQDSTLVERLDAASGQVQSQVSLDDMAFEMRQDTENPQQIRVYFSNRIDFLDVGDLSVQSTFSPPESVDMDLWRYNELTCAPFDALLSTEQLVYTAEDGIYLAGLDGVAPQLILENKDLSDVLTGVEMPEHDPAQLHYVAPLLMNGGERLVASTYMVEDSTGELGGYVSRPYGISVVELNSGVPTHYPDVISWISNPAAWLNDDRISFLGEGGCYFYTPSTDEITTADFDFHLERLFDENTVVQLNDDGTALSTYPAGNPEEQTLLLEAPDAYHLEMYEVTESYIVLSCLSGDDTYLILVSYR